MPKPVKTGIETLAHMGLFGTVAVVAVLCSVPVFLLRPTALSHAFLRIEDLIEPDRLGKLFTLLG